MVKIEVWDWDWLKRDDLIGETKEISLDFLMKQRDHIVNISTNNHPEGTITLDVFTRHSRK